MLGTVIGEENIPKSPVEMLSEGEDSEDDEEEKKKEDRAAGFGQRVISANAASKK